MAEDQQHGKVEQLLARIAIWKGVQGREKRTEYGRLATFDSLKASASNKVDVKTVGLTFLKENKVGDAITIFKKNLGSFPEQPLVYESYGEAMATTGNWTEALKYYTQALSRDRGNMNAKEILRHISK
jgi:predicted Zn-dependent protease